eukprot:1859851-Prorocentrum_lima.AAC.1
MRLLRHMHQQWEGTAHQAAPLWTIVAPTSTSGHESRVALRQTARWMANRNLTQDPEVAVR